MIKSKMHNLNEEHLDLNKNNVLILFLCISKIGYTFNKPKYSNGSVVSNVTMSKHY